MERCTQFYSQYCITVGIYCILLYLYGFFPIKKSSNVFSSEEDFPRTLQGLKLNTEKVYNSSVSKTVLMVIDALRVDFVTSDQMPYTAAVVGGRKEGGCQLTARVAAPTVTLPRIKAIVTGSVSGFIDVVLNLGTMELTSDNIIQQFSRTRKSVFYGDDTWIKLFPENFLRSDGTSSFFVNDYTEVDNNVTRHLDKELDRSDWDLMILHYLGLDHIGHIEGPKSSLITPKLREMDSIIQRLHRYLLKQGGGVLVICGDHGMKDSGSHGGVSLPEVLVPVVVLGLSCSQKFKQEILQVDLAATLCVLWGSPIPADNIGVVTSALIAHLTPPQRLYAHLLNAEQLSSNFLRNGGHTKHEAYKTYEEAKQRHYEWLVNESTLSHHEVEMLYQNSLTKMSRFLSEALANYNMAAMCSAIVILFQVFCIMGLTVAGIQTTFHQTKKLFTLTIGSVAVFFVISSLTSFSMVLFMSGMCFIFNSFTLYRQLKHIFPLLKSLKTIRPNVTYIDVILPVGTVMFCLSLFSSSLIEEEHQLWYFLWATIGTVQLMVGHGRWFAVLVAHRFLRRLNSTGDKWAHWPDTSDWLLHKDNRAVLSALCAISLLCVVWCCAKTCYHRISVVLYICAAFCIYQYKASIQQVISVVPFSQTSGVTEARICWILLLALLLLGRSAKTLLVCWMLAVSLLLRPYNTLLVPCLFLTSKIVATSLSTVLYLWIGSAFYFYQGNSNSLASVDIAAGFAGLEGYNVSMVAVLLFVHTYAMPVLAYLLLMNEIIEKNREWKKLIATADLVVFLQLLHVFVCLIVITLHRYHLFVWTVFSPKLLYVGAQSLVYFVLVSITNLCIYCVKLNKNLHYFKN